MQDLNQSKRRASSLLRTLVVASATLAILLVCFSMYQFSQVEQKQPAAKPQPRLPSPRTQASLDESTATPVAVDEEGGFLGAGRDIKLTIYAREGRRARMEIEVRDWTPKPGAANVFILVDPIARMRTKDGNAVRIMAKRGVLEAKRHGSGSLDPQRGRLTGGVTIEFDRLNEKQRAALPEDQRQPTPAQLIRVTTEEVEFDLEYSKLIMPSRVELMASDVEFVAHNLEIRFNDDDDSLESLRVSRGGRITLRGAGDSLGFPIPGMAAKQEQPFTLAQWLHTTLQSALDANLKPPTEEITIAAAPDGPDSVSKEMEFVDGVPVFRRDVEDKNLARPEIRYFARFEGDVLARQISGGKTAAKLQADLLEMIREFSGMDKDRMRSEPSQTSNDPSQSSTARSAVSQEVVLTWSKRLVIEAIRPNDLRWGKESQDTITAIGTPTRLSHPDGDATCIKLVYHPNGNEVWLWGEDDQPAIVRSIDQGKIIGNMIYTRREGDTFEIKVDGPGALQPAGNMVSALSSFTGKNDQAQPATTTNGTLITFDDRLEAHGTVLTKTVLNFTGGLVSRRFRILDTATITGNANIQQKDSNLESDVITLTFGARHSNREIQQTIEKLHGQGHVRMTQQLNILTCDEIDVRLATAQDGRIYPSVATALGHVEAVQDQRIIKAADKLIVDFALIPKPSRKEKKEDIQKVAARGTRESDLQQQPVDRIVDENDEDPMQVGMKRLRAFGDVSVLDQTQNLELNAHTLDCALDGEEIQSAIVTGYSPQQPATVKLDTFAITGQEIKLNVPDQWAEVPGQGRMTFLSRKDLNGRKMSEPVPISISWGNWMKYRGRENRAIFDGQVHATSQTTTTFDCSRLAIEFDDVPEKVAVAKVPQENNWMNSLGILKLINPMQKSKRKSSRSRPRFSKEPAFILASGNAVALTSEIDPVTHQLKSRARITGPTLSVNLRPDVSKMLIEGEGSLQMEDFQPGGGDLFNVADDGPSKTLITWKDSMWYDFSIDQTRFEGDVELKYFSGDALKQLFGGKQTQAKKNDQTPSGRRTFLSCDVLTVDFLDRSQRARHKADRRVGRISTNALRQFQASGNVTLQDQSEGLSLWSDRLIYERPRRLLQIFGTDYRKAKIIKETANKMPYQLSAKHIFYNLGTGEIEVLGPTVMGQ